MDSLKKTSDTDENEVEFCRLLKEIQAGKASSEALLVNPVFNKRLRLIAMTYAPTAHDTKELENDVRILVWRTLKRFKPDYTKPYGKFFAWLKVLTRNVFADSCHSRSVDFDDRRLDDLSNEDVGIDIEASVLYREVIAEFEKNVNALPLRERLAVGYYLQGFSFRETSAKMGEAGFQAGHVTVRKWVRESLSAFFESSQLNKPRGNSTSQNSKVTKARATRAKREFFSILEQAINSGTAAIQEDTRKVRSAPLVGRKTPKATRAGARPGWESALDLLKKMQTPESKQGRQAAFEASPEELGRAAVKYANKARNVPVASLTTFLMATSTVSVVGRVMGLSGDVA
jgi:antitoxin Phd